jgi:hypothetical protein
MGVAEAEIAELDVELALELGLPRLVAVTCARGACWRRIKVHADLDIFRYSQGQTDRHVAGQS